MTYQPPGPALTGLGAAVPHLAVPFAIGTDGAALTVDQDSEADVASCVSALVGTRPTERIMVPSYGIADPTFTGLDRVAVADAIAAWEPRADVTITVGDTTDAGTEAMSITVRVASGIGGPAQ